MRKLLTLTLLLTMTIMIAACGDNEDKNIDYLKGDKASVEKGLIGMWKTTQYQDDGLPYTMYYKYDGKQRWSGSDLNNLTTSVFYQILNENNLYKILINSEGGIKWEILTLNKNELVVNLPNNANRSYTRLE